MDRKTSAVLAFAVSSLLIVAPALAYVSLGFTSSVTPTTVSPGDKANLYLTISNPGTEAANNVKLQIGSTQYINAQIPSFDLGTLNAGASTQVVVPVSVLSGAPEGTQVIPYSVSYGFVSVGGTVTAQNSAPIVITKRSIVEISNVTYSEPTIQRGDDVQVILTLTNAGSGEVRDMVLSLATLPTGITVANAGGERFVGSLQPGESKQVAFDVSVNSGADTITYNLPVDLSFYDNQGAAHSDSKQVGLKVEGIPDFVVAVDTVTGVSPSTTGKVTVSIANSGTGTSKYLYASASSDAQISPLVSYVGNMDPDDTNSVTYEVQPVSSGRHWINVTLSYKDSYNRDGSKSYTLEFQSGSAASEFPTAYVAVILVVILALLYWKRHAVFRIIKRK